MGVHRIRIGAAAAAFIAGSLASCAAPPTVTPPAAPTQAAPPAHASPGDTWVRPADGAVMVLVPAGEFPYGPGSASHPPQQKVHLDAFWIDRTEVTNVQYALCVSDGGCDAPLLETLYQDPARTRHPVVWVSHTEAEVYCAWAGARLPTEIEWEKAARGTDGRKFPWGDELSAERANFYESGLGDATPVGSYPQGASPYGALDMAGNVCEWVQDLWRTGEAYREHPILPPGRRPVGEHPVGHHYTLRGGSWAQLADRITTYARANEEPVWRTKDIGFRCAVSAPRAEPRR